MKARDLDEQVMIMLANHDPAVEVKDGKFKRAGVEITIPQLFGYQKDLGAWQGILEFFSRMGIEFTFGAGEVKAYGAGHSIQSYGDTHPKCLFKMFENPESMLVSILQENPSKTEEVRLAMKTNSRPIPRSKRKNL